MTAMPLGRRRLATPEGVELSIDLADRGDRAGAFLIDFCFLAIAIVVLVLASLWIADWAGEDGKIWGTAIFLIGLFLLRVFYFTGFELAWRGATPGKRLLRLRVIDRRGRALSADAIVARNLTREIEFFLPFNILLAGPALAQLSMPLWIALIAWCGIFTLMPIFNRDRLRVGDMIAGTWVITLPKTALPSEIAAATISSTGAAKTAPSEPERAYRFSDSQLDIYGIFELQTLEGLLRRGGTLGDGDALEIAERIARRIDWPEPIGTAEARIFLEDFYAAQRARLERRLLFGKRRKDKHDRE